MKKDDSNFLFYGLIIGGILSAGLVILVGSKIISNAKRNKRERKHKFFEGIDDIFDESAKSMKSDDNRLDKKTEDGIIDELFSRNN